MCFMAYAYTDSMWSTSFINTYRNTFATSGEIGPAYEVVSTVRVVLAFVGYYRKA